MAQPNRPHRSVLVRPDGTRLVRLGIGGSEWADVYHLLLRTTWPRFILALTVGWFAVNAGFGLAYWTVGGVENASGSYADAFFFSVQTFGTIGYGKLVPVTLAAHWLVTCESFVGMFGMALVTGLVFAKFARPTARVLWSNVAVITKRNGIPTIMIRLANERANGIAEAQFRMTALVDMITPEGERIRKLQDLELVTKLTPTFSFSFTIMHAIGPTSPLYGKTPEDLQKANIQIICGLMGIDDTLSATVSARQIYDVKSLRWNEKFVDVLAPLQDGSRVVDYTKFHDTVPESAT